MKDLLTTAEYEAIACALNFPQVPFVDGKFRSGNGARFETINPANGEVITEIVSASQQDIDFAVQKAREAFNQGTWSQLAPSERKVVLLDFCKLIKRFRRELAVMESLDSGKPIRDCDLLDVPETIATIRWHAELIDKLYDDVAPTSDDAMAIIRREPIGVVAAVLPWNFPLLMMAWKIGPALASGNSIIIKPAEQTSLTALYLAEIAQEAGIPSGVLQVLPGDGVAVGEPLGRHMDVDMVSFTGSTDTGRMFLRYAADSNLKKIVLECGGKNPAVVLDDAENLDHVAEQIVFGAFWNMGENCSASSRLIVHKDIKAPLLERINARLRDWKTGYPLDPEHQLGALVDTNHVDKVSSYLRGLDAPDGPYVTPKIYEVKPDEALAQEEVFGPILSVIEVTSANEAIHLANDTKYGLTASVFSSNINRAMRTAFEIKAGTVTVNCYGEGDLSTPFGGFKQSGFGGRDNGVHAHDQYTELKTIWFDLKDPKDGDNVD